MLNDRFELKSSNNNAVCIFSLTINGTQILNGRNNNQSAFWLDEGESRCDTVSVIDDFGNNVRIPMVTPDLIIQDNQVISSQCKGII